ncbi:MAG: zinc-ribbon domain-containing protein [Lachnospiraceae bacterium]|nr:zinc-ribbon domain-containing protein [Lachnospiraceae bacterium]
MDCKNCGHEIPEGAAFCSFCGGAAPVDMGTQQPQMDMGYQQPVQPQMDMGYQQPVQPQMDMGYQQPMGQPQMNMGYQQPMGQPQMDIGYQEPYRVNTSYAQVPETNKKNVVIALVVGTLAIVAIVLLLVFVVFKDGKNIDGTYGTTYFDSIGADAYIEIDGDEYTLTIDYYGMEDSTTGKCEYDGDILIIHFDGEEYECDYDEDEKSFVFDGVEFTKE